MPYLNIDDGMPDHPDVWELSSDAFRLYVAAMCYCAKWGTDGYLPRNKVRSLTPNADDVLVAELVGLDLFHDLGEGCSKGENVEARECHGEGVRGRYIVHNFLRWNHSADWWQKRKSDQRERKAKYDAKRRAERGPEHDQ